MGRDTRYARSDDVNIAYQVVGEGPIDLVYVMGWVSHLDYFWEEPSFSQFLNRLASFSRLILFDKRGTGLSDRVGAPPTLEQRMDDVRAVMDAVGSDSAALVGVSEGGPMCALFAATYPRRTRALVMIGSYARRLRDESYPWGPTREEHARFMAEVEDGWGGPVGLEARAPSMAGDERFRDWWANYLRMSASPGAALALTKMNAEIDVRPVLPSIRVPTLLIHRRGDRALSVGGSRYMAGAISGATLLELPGDDHLPFAGNMNEILDPIEEFLTGSKHIHDADRTLATVMFADIVGSTEKAVSIGDHAWRSLLADYYALVEKDLARWRGRKIDTAGDGVLALFDGPARAVRGACSIRDGVRRLGLEVRAGLHTGECEVVGSNVGGVAVHTGARVAELASPGEVWTSGTVRDLVAGSGIGFRSRGEAELKGIPERRSVFMVVDQAQPVDVLPRPV